jgi:hypothetical protein
MDSALIAEFEKGGYRVFEAVQIEWEAEDAPVMRLVSGGFVTFSVDGSDETFIARDTIYGVLGSVSAFRDGIEAQAPRGEVTLLGPSSDGIGYISAEKSQGSRVRIWNGAVNPSTGAVVGAPELIFDGEFDYADIPTGASSTGWVLNIGTRQERQLEPDAQRRLTDAYHQSVWPGELGCKNVSAVNRKIYWRLATPTGGVGGGGGGGGGNGGGGGIVDLL